MQIDVISDTICPWCFIGKRRLEKAMAQRPEMHFDVVWRPYQLHPDVPEGGVDRKKFMEAKFGSREGAKTLYDHVRKAAEGEGLELSFSKQEKVPNTLKSHRVAHWAHTAGVQDAVIEGMFKAYFMNNEDVEDDEVLIKVAAQAGMDAEIVRNLLDSGADKELIEQEEMVARRMGVTGVPCFIIGQKYAIVGAEEPDMILRAIDQAAQEIAQAHQQDAPAE